MEAEFNPEEGVLIKNKEDVIEKLRSLLRDGIESLQVITDFDQTLTRAFVNGNKANSTFCVLHG